MDTVNSYPDAGLCEQHLVDTAPFDLVAISRFKTFFYVFGFKKSSNSIPLKKILKKKKSIKAKTESLLSLTERDYGGKKNECNEVPWIGSWNRKDTLEKLEIYI